MLESNVWGENSFLFIHTTWIGNDLLKIRKMNRAELILKTAYSSAIAGRHCSCRHLENKVCQTSRPLSPSPPFFARTFSSKERRLGTRELMNMTFVSSNLLLILLLLIESVSLSGSVLPRYIAPIQDHTQFCILVNCSNFA